MELEYSGIKYKNESLINFLNNHKSSIINTNHSRYIDVLNYIPQNKYGLDYGCGWGCFTEIMKEKTNSKILGIDLNQDDINICKYVWNDTNYMSCKIDEFESNTFDFVVSNQVIEHTHNPGNYLSEINRVLKDDGILIISLPNILTIRNIFSIMRRNFNTQLINLSKDIFNNYNKTHDHIQGWDPEHFTRLASSVGFVLKEFHPSEGIPLPFWFKKLKLPTYIYSRKRWKNLCYTMIFVFEKKSYIKIEKDN